MKLRWWNDARDVTVSSGPSMNAPALVLGGPRPVPIDGPSTQEVWDGGGGDDTHNGTNGDDTLDGLAGNDTIDGKKGDDDITGNTGDDTLFGGDGNDTLHVGAASTDTVFGGKGDDLIVFDAAGGLLDTPDGGAGFDTLDASGATASYGILNSVNIEHYILSEGNDEFGGLSGDQIIDGGGGDDRLYGGLGDDELNGGAGFDYAIYSLAASGVQADLSTHKAKGGEDHDKLGGIEGLIGSNFDDKLTGDNKDNDLAGLEGDDVLDGGGGEDFAFYNSTDGNVTVNLTTGKSSGALGRDTLKNMEGIIGGGGNDKLTGNDRATLLDGGDGNDTLTDGLGEDQMFGGTGSDKFVFLDLDHSSHDADFVLIADAQAGERVDLSGIQAIEGHANSSFDLVDEFSGDGGEAIISYHGGSDETFIELDTDGGAHPEANLVIVISGNHTSDLDIVL